MRVQELVLQSEDRVSVGGRVRPPVSEHGGDRPRACSPQDNEKSGLKFFRKTWLGMICLEFAQEALSQRWCRAQLQLAAG